jgi:hypothetical protein
MNLIMQPRHPERSEAGSKDVPMFKIGRFLTSFAMTH